MAKKERKAKPGPDPEVLKIEGDPEEALQKLVSTPPPKEDRPEPESDEEPRGD
jgi:hypothetical protein